MLRLGGMPYHRTDTSLQPIDHALGSMTMSPSTAPTPTATDAALARSLAADFDRGFTELVRSHQAGIYAGALRLLWQPQTAEDIAQDTFLRAYRALSGYDDERIRAMRFRPWLWTIALNLCRNHATRTPATSPLPATERTGSEDAEPFDDERWNSALAGLPDPQRTAVVLRHVADLPISEIAAITGRAEGTVKSDISRGLDRLRTTLDTEEDA